MDPTRQVRLAIPPFFFFACLLSAKFFADPEECLGWIEGHEVVQLGALVALVAIASLPIGFIVSTLTTFILRFGFILIRDSNYETNIKTDDILPALRMVCPKLATHADSQVSLKWWRKKKNLRNAELLRYTIVAFDHGFLCEKYPGIHHWLGRVYNIFMVSANSAVAVLLALGVVMMQSDQSSSEWYDKFPPDSWFIVTCGLLVTLFLGALYTRHVTLRMMRFLLDGFTNNEMKEEKTVGGEGVEQS